MNCMMPGATAIVGKAENGRTSRKHTAEADLVAAVQLRDRNALFSPGGSAFCPACSRRKTC